MRILAVHNQYSSRVPSGENLAVEDEVGWLCRDGVDARVHRVSNDQLLDAGAVHKIGQAAQALWSPSAARRMTETIESWRPDVVHVHNLFPLLSASAAWAALRQSVPVVWTVHNRRALCVIGTNFRDGQPCHRCKPWRRTAGIRHGCYGGSPVASSLVTGATTVFAALARRRITAIAISETMRRWLTDEAGFPSEAVRVKYNGVAASPSDLTLPPAATRRTFLFAGYLTDYKGTELMLEAWRRASLPDDCELRVIGDGPMAGAVQAAAESDTRINWFGNRPAVEMPGHLAEARVVVVPSIWEEPFGRSAAEALAYRRPVITSGTGGLSEIIDGDVGWVTGLQPDDLARALETAATDDAAVAHRSQRAVLRHSTTYSPEATTAELIRIYEDVMSTTRTH